MKQRPFVYPEWDSVFFFLVESMETKKKLQKLIVVLFKLIAY